MRGCKNVTHNEVDCSHLASELRCENCLRNEIDDVEARLEAGGGRNILIRCDLLVLKCQLLERLAVS